MFYCDFVGESKDTIIQLLANSKRHQLINLTQPSTNFSWYIIVKKDSGLSMLDTFDTLEDAKDVFEKFYV